MSAHTPGSWHWEADAVERDPMGRVRYQVTALGKTITRVYYSSYEGGATSAEADARLIAAAPDLLEALVLLEREMVASGNAGSEDYGWKPAIAKTRAAIAKATPP